jgi:hypothetical protein
MVPVVLSLLLLGAHFLRAEQLVLVGLSVAFLGLLAVRRAWSAAVLQVVLVLGALEWARTVMQIARWRAESGMPFLRMAVILGCVTIMTGLSALMFRTTRLQQWFNRDHRGRAKRP